jgi:tRNA A37 methylthiotransferase MiaB
MHAVVSKRRYIICFKIIFKKSFWLSCNLSSRYQDVFVRNLKQVVITLLQGCSDKTTDIPGVRNKMLRATVIILLTTCYVQTISDLLEQIVASLLAPSNLLQDDNIIRYILTLAHNSHIASGSLNDQSRTHLGIKVLSTNSPWLSILQQILGRSIHKSTSDRVWYIKMWTGCNRNCNFKNTSRIVNL